MGKNQVLIKRNATIILTLREAADALGYKNMGSDSDYLDADPQDDTYHEGYSNSTHCESECPLPDAYELFPEKVELAMEDADRDAMANAMGDARRNSIKEAFLLLNKLHCSYEGNDSTGKPQSVTIDGGILNVDIDVPANQVKILILNPEHVLADMLSTNGYWPTEIFCDIALDDKQLKSYLIANVGAYIDNLGMKLPDRHVSERFGDKSGTPEQIKSLLEERLKEIDEVDVANAVIKACENKKYDDVSDAIAAASRLTDVPKDTLAKLVKESAEKTLKDVTERMAKYL